MIPCVLHVFLLHFVLCEWTCDVRVYFFSAEFNNSQTWVTFSALILIVSEFKSSRALMKSLLWIRWRRVLKSWEGADVSLRCRGASSRVNQGRVLLFLSPSSSSAPKERAALTERGGSDTRRRSSVNLDLYLKPIDGRTPRKSNGHMIQIRAGGLMVYGFWQTHLRPQVCPRVVRPLEYKTFKENLCF